MKKLYILLVSVLIMVVMGCASSNNDAPLSSAKAITAFKITFPVAATGAIIEETHTIAVTVPNGTSVTNMTATFTTTGVSVEVNSIVQTSSTENDFTNSTINPKIYTVIAADGSKQNYNVTVTVSQLSGSLDTNFGTSGMVTTFIGSSDDEAYAFGFQSDGKIVAAGFSFNGTNYNITLVRYKTDGTPDTSGTPGIGFGTTGIVTTAISGCDAFALAVAIQSDDKIVVAGYSHNSANHEYDFALVRYNSDGTLDADTVTGFGATHTGIVTTRIETGNTIYGKVYALGIQPVGGTSDFKIVVAGYSYNNNNNKNDFALVRYTKDGIPDATFGTNGIVTTSIEHGSLNDYANALGIQPDGKIVVAGYSYTGSKYFISLVRYNTDGTPDTSGTLGIGFGTTGIVTTSIRNLDDRAHALAIQPVVGTSDFKIVVAGTSSTSDNKDYDFALVRYNADGSLDADSSTGFGATHTGIVTTPIGTVTATLGSGFDWAYALGIQPSDGKILAVGSSNNGSNYDFALVRYTKDGIPDATFGTNGIVTTPIGSSDDYAFALGIQPVVGSSDFKIVVAGTSYNLGSSKYDFALVRYLP